MSWNIVPNCHVRIWIAAPIGVVPAGAATIDTTAQLMAPTKPPFSQAVAWGPRLVLGPAPFSGDVKGFLGDGITTATYLAFVDDVATIVYGWWVAVDVSLSTRPGAIPGQFIVDAGFVLLQAVDAF